MTQATPDRVSKIEIPLHETPNTQAECKTGKVGIEDSTHDQLLCCLIIEPVSGIVILFVTKALNFLYSLANVVLGAYFMSLSKDELDAEKLEFIHSLGDYGLISDSINIAFSIPILFLMGVYQ